MEAVKIRQTFLGAIFFILFVFLPGYVLAQNQIEDTIPRHLSDTLITENQNQTDTIAGYQQTEPIDISGEWNLRQRTLTLAYPPLFRHSPIMLDDNYIDYASFQVLFNQYTLEEGVHYFFNKNQNILYLDFRPEETDSVIVIYNNIPLSLNPIYSLDSSVIQTDADFFAFKETPELEKTEEQKKPKDGLSVSGYKGFYIDTDASGFDISQDIEITIDGNVSDSTTLYAYIYDARRDNRLYAQTQFQDLGKIDIKIKDPDYEINAGDINIKREQKDLTYFNRNLRGIDAVYSPNRFNKKYRGSVFSGYRRFERYSTEIVPIQGIKGPYKIDKSSYGIFDIKLFQGTKNLEEGIHYTIDRITYEIYFSDMFISAVNEPVVAKYSREDNLNFRFNTGVTGGVDDINDMFSAEISWYNDYVAKPNEKLIDRINDTIAVYESLNSTLIEDLPSRVSGAYVQMERTVSGRDSTYYIFYPINQIKAMGFNNVYFPEFYKVEPGEGDYIRDSYLSSLHSQDVYKFDITSVRSDYRIGLRRYVPVDRNLVVPTVKFNADSVITARYSHGVLVKDTEDVSTGRYFDASLNIKDDNFNGINSSIKGFSIYVVNHHHSPGFSTLDTWKDKYYFFENWRITDYESNVIEGAENNFTETYFGMSPEFEKTGFDISIGEYKNRGYDNGEMKIDRFSLSGDYRATSNRYIDANYTFWRYKFARSEFTKNRLRLNSNFDFYNRVSVSPYVNMFYGNTYRSDTTYTSANTGSNAVVDIGNGWGASVTGDYKLDRIYWQKNQIDYQLDSMITITKGASLFYNSLNNSFESNYIATETRRESQTDNFYNFSSFYSHKNDYFSSRTQFSRETSFDRLMYPDYLWVGRNNGDYIFNQTTGIFEYAGDNNGDFIRSEDNYETTGKTVAGKSLSFNINFNTYIAPSFDLRIYESSNKSNIFPVWATYDNSRSRGVLTTEINPALTLSPKINPLKISYYNYTSFNRYYEAEFDLTREVLLENEIRYLRDFFYQQLVITQDNSSFVRLDKELNVEDVAYSNFHFSHNRYFSRKNLIVAVDTIYDIKKDETGAKTLVDIFDTFKFPLGGSVSRNSEGVTGSLYYLWSVNLGVRYIYRNAGIISLENFINYRRDESDNIAHAFFYKGYKDGINYDMRINGGFNATDRLIFNTWYNMKIRKGESLWHQLSLDLRYYF